MDSQLTLISQPSTPEVTLVLELTRDDMNNTEMYLIPSLSPSSCSPEKSLRYRVVSCRDITTTTISRASNSIEKRVALIQRNTILSDKITLLGGQGEEKLVLGKWLKRRVDEHFAMEFQVDGQGYLWKANFMKQLALYHPSDLQTPIAWFNKSLKRVSEDGLGERILTTTPATLALCGPAETIEQQVVISLIVAEQKLRMQVKGEGLAQGRAAPGTMIP